MSPDGTVERDLSSIRELSEALAVDVEGLSPTDWERPTNCPPWLVRTLAAHVVTSGEVFATAVWRGLEGSVERAADADARASREAAREDAGPAHVAAALRIATAVFVDIYDGLSEEQLAAVCYHRRGNQSVRWYATHRLAEVAFHSWDLRESLGRDPDLDDAVATLLLPTLLETNSPRTYAAGVTPERGGGERYLLSVAGDPSQRWLLRIDPDQLVVERSDGSADLEITATAGNVALLVYGRRHLTDLSRPTAFRLDGDKSLVARFAATFPKP
jgi:uncharacterized protein (TIGR03083 family)